MRVRLYLSDIPQKSLCHTETVVLNSGGILAIRKLGERNGVYTPTKSGEADAAGICYLSAEK